MIDSSDFLVLSPHTTEGLSRCFEKLRELGATSGDYLEFGVFQGHSLLHAYREAERLGLGEMRFFGFDSFAGLPEPDGADDAPMHTLTGVDRLEAGMFVSSREEVLARLAAHGADLSRIRLVEGYFHDTLNPATRERLGLREAAIVLVDCDLYDSTRRVLDFVRELLRDRSILVFDDWNIFGADPARGERRAFAEFLERNPGGLRPETFVPLGWHGQSFILRDARTG
ncbi:MAG TPA: TylF/MycF/NovP-related O-methyltransferase [Longimicrobiaceae bacterium]|nr:TylF/MycF/NovP-related O-methyltransferase [Longimicrobiaceae bacterium]